MTEDDTFQALKRLPLDVLSHELQISGGMTNDDRIEWYKTRGWTREEYKDAMLDLIRKDAECQKKTHFKP